MYWPGETADRHIVAVDVAGVIGLQDVALQTDGRDLGLHRLAHDRGQGGALIGSDDQQVGLLANEGLHLRHLFAVVLLRVGDDQLDVAGFVEQLLHQRVLRRAVRLGIVALAEGDEELLLLRRRGVAATGGDQQRNAGQNC